MFEDLKDSKKRTVGAKQTMKAIKDGLIEKVFIARDADDYVVDPVIHQCEAFRVEIVFVESMKDLGGLCGIDVAASSVGLLKN